jgi:hypothetical protein
MPTIIVQVVSLIAAIAAVIAGVLMANVTKRFGTGILASGFKTISLGVFFVVGGIVLDAANTYLQITDLNALAIITLLKSIFFVVGTFIIVNGSKKTSEKLESLTK